MSKIETKERRSARVLLVDDMRRVLLFRSAAEEPDDTIWITPGGGVDDGETLGEAAVRELAEETGLTIAVEQVGDVVAVDTGKWISSDAEVVFDGTDNYFFVRTSSHDVDDSGHTDLERRVLAGHRWWTIDELRASRERIYPVGLADLLEELLDGGTPARPKVLQHEHARERVRGCVLAGAVGDALGNPIEFMSLDEIRREHGPDGLTSMISDLITDDTQMTLFTAEGLLNAGVDGDSESIRVSVHRAYLDWLRTQDEHAPAVGAAGLAAEPWLYARRAPGNACLSGLRHTGPGPINPHSKGCGTVMRSAPFGLLGLGADAAFHRAADCAALTHGHPTAAAAAGAFAAIVDGLLAGTSLDDAVSTVVELMGADDRSAETVAALRNAVQLAQRGNPTPAMVELLGGGWVAEEALAIAIYCALVSDHSAAALLLAVNHSGDSDSTGSICGNLVGAWRGQEELSRQWANAVEGRATINSVAAALSERREVVLAQAR